MILSNFSGPLVHGNMKHTRSNHSSCIFSICIAGSKVERYTETAEEIILIYKDLLL